MTKAQFGKRIRLIQNFISEQETLGVLIKQLTDEMSIITMGDWLLDTVIDMIREDLQIQDDDLLYWWLWEDVDKVIYVNDKEVSVRTPEELYDYIVSCHREASR